MSLFSSFFKNNVAAAADKAALPDPQNNLQIDSAKSSTLEPLVDTAGLPLNALDWLADRQDGKLLLEMPAPQGCSAAQLARNRLDWYVLPDEYNNDVESIVKSVMGYNLLSSNVESNSWYFDRFKGDKPLPLLYHEWADEVSKSAFDNIFGEPIAPTMQASISTLANILSDVINTPLYFINARDKSIETKKWQFSNGGGPSLEYVRINVFSDYQAIKRRKSPMLYKALSLRDKENRIGDFMQGVDLLDKPGGIYDQLIEGDQNPMGWSSEMIGDNNKEDDNISYITNRDSILLIKNIRPLLKVHGVLRRYVLNLFGIAGRVGTRDKARYTNFLSGVSSYGASEPLEVGGYKSIITESRIPLPGVSAFSFKPLDLMMIEAFSDPRVPSTGNAKESYPVVKELIKERLPVYRKRLAEIFAEDQRIADEAGLERDEGCEYSIADWGDESLANQVGQAEAERLGFVK